MRAGSLRRRVSGVRHVPAWSTCEQVCTALAECGLKAGETRCAQPGRTQEAAPRRAAGRLGAARRAAPLGSPPQKSLEPRPSPREPRWLMSTRVHRPVPRSEGLFPRPSEEDLTPVPDMLAVLAGHLGASHHNRASDSATPPPIAPWFKIRLKGKTPWDSADSFGVVDTRCVPSPFVWNAEFLSAQNRQSAWETRSELGAARGRVSRAARARGARGSRSRCGSLPPPDTARGSFSAAFKAGIVLSWVRDPPPFVVTRGCRGRRRGRKNAGPPAPGLRAGHGLGT